MRLTRELIDQIVFGMENQDREYVLDTEEATVIPEEQIPPEAPPDRFLSLPAWRSVNGYNLMEQFVATLHNPIFRERLRAILASGRGVFRQFKDTIRERREIERLWFSFKERRMREIVTEWFNDLREREGLERLEATTTEPETDQLIESDFVFRDADDADFPLLTELDHDAFLEIYPDAHSDAVALYHEDSRAGVPDIADPSCTVVVAETQGEDFAGFIWLVARRTNGTAIGFVKQLYVVPEYRGLGLARELFFSVCRRAYREGLSEIHVPLNGKALDLEQSFLNYGLERHGVTLGLDLARWHRSETG
ncbi:MAG: GNAT family N-acetyltransferase [Spirochaetota bacterium]